MVVRYWLLATGQERLREVDYRLSYKSNRSIDIDINLPALSAQRSIN